MAVIKTRSRKILIVDDVKFVRKALAKILTDNHFTVVGEAEDGAKAVELYQKLQPDAITMDIVMPKMGGIEAIRQILKFDKNAKVIVISAMSQEHLMMEAINAGAKDYVVKPFKAEDIIRTLEHTLTSEEKIAERAARLEQSKQ